MTQNPLDNIRKRTVAQRPVFPNPMYEQEVLEPARAGINLVLTDAAVQVHQARIVDLVEVRTVEKADAREALRALDNVQSAGEAGQTPLAAVEQVLAEAGGGRALLASAPEEVEAAAERLVMRERLLDIAQASLGFRSALSQLALGHLTTVITTTSNGQMLQPSTLAHYLTSHLGPLSRTMARISALFERVNRSPLGAVSGMASAVPSRRERQAELLGFDGMIEHTFDALAAADTELEISSMLTGLSLELLRLVNDLSGWARDDTGTVVPSVEFVHTGGAQPQRRDPLLLDHLRVRLTEQVAASNTIAMLLSGRSMLAGSATRQRVFMLLHDQIASTEITLNLLSRLLATVEVNRALTANRTHKGFATSSELADLLAIDGGLSRSDAYLLAERIATEATILALGGMTLDTKLVDKLALEVVGREIGIEPETLGKCLSVKRFVERREVHGGPAPASVRDMIEREHLARRRDDAWVQGRRDAIATAMAGLNEQVQALRDA